MRSNVLVGIALILGSLAFAAAANADSFVLTNSNGGDGYVDTTPGGFDLFSANNAVLDNITTYQATSLSNQTLEFAWTYITHDIGTSAFEPAGYILNGVLTQLSISGLSFGGSISDSFSLSLALGDTYGFYAKSLDGQFGRGEIQVTISAVPEASTWAMMIAAFGGLGFSLRRRARTVA